MGPPGTAPARVGRRAAGPRCWLPRWVGRVSAPASAGGRVRVAPAHPVPDLRWSCTLARNAQAPCSLDGRRGLRRGGRGPHDRLLRRRPGRLPAGCAPGPDGSQLLAHRLVAALLVEVLALAAVAARHFRAGLAIPARGPLPIRLGGFQLAVRLSLIQVAAFTGLEVGERLVSRI